MQHHMGSASTVAAIIPITVARPVTSLQAVSSAPDINHHTNHADINTIFTSSKANAVPQSLAIVTAKEVIDLPV